MGLLSALSNAVSGLNVNQQNLDVLSQNISNANTANYSNEIVNEQAVYEAGAGVGVSVESVTRTVNQYLTAAVQQQTSVNGSASAVQGYYNQIENLLGQPGGTTSIDQGIDSFFSALQSLANSPSASNDTVAVNAAVSAAQQVSGLASSLQNLRLQADSQIGSDINNVNADLQTLNSTNSALELASATGQSTAGLLDQRDAAIADIAQYIDVKPTYSEDGQVSLSTTNGLTLLTPTSSSKLTYTPVSSVQTLINNGNLSPIQIQTLNPNGTSIGNPVTLATGGTSSSVTTSLVSGQIQGLMSIRDSVIPNILNQLDQLSNSLTTSVNAISNDGSSYPPPNSYTGQREVTASSATQWSGNVQIALLDSSGNPAPSPYSDETNGVQPLTLNLGTLLGSGGTGVLSTSNIINAINQYYTPQNKVEIGNLNNVQLAMESSSVPAAGNQMNFDFNLNNISANSGSFFLTGVTVLDSSGNPLSSNDVSVSQPSAAITSYVSNAQNTVTVNTQGASGFTNGEVVYLNAASDPILGGTPLPAGYYSVNNVTGSSFDITLAGVPGGGASFTPPAGEDEAIPPSTSVGSGDTVSTGSNGSVTVTNLPSGSSSPYFTVNATIGTINADGDVVTSTVTYTIANNSSNVLNNLIGAGSATGDGTIVAPTSRQPLVTAELVDANGNPLTETNGSYGNQQGYLEIAANNSTYTVAINELDSQQQGLPTASPPQAGTNQGFSQYYGLNDFFNVNQPTATGSTVANSAINLSVNSNLVDNPGLITTGTLSLSPQPSDASSPPNFTYLVASGDNSNIQAMAALATATEDFPVTGGMPSSSTTFAQYAGQIIAKTSSDASDASNTATDAQTLLSGYTTQAQNVSGVNLDQELANTVIYQNAYTASTRVITVVSNMFEQLLGIIQ